MAQSVELEALIDAVASAVIGAQDKIEVYQAGLLSQYLDPEHRPRVLEIRVPSTRADAKPGDEVTLHVPILSLVGATRLAISSMEVTMDVDLGDIHEVEPEYETQDGEGQPPLVNSLGRPPQPRRTMSVDMNSPRSQSRDALGKVTLKVAALEPTEGIHRLMLELNKRIGVVDDG